MNLSNVNAADLRSWLGLPAGDLVGQMAAWELAARCRRRLWDEPRNHDAGLSQEHGDRYVFCGRPAGYLRQRTAELLALAVRAGDGVISWA